MSCDCPWLVHVQWHGLRYHVPSLFYLTTCHMAGSHVGKLHVILDMEGHVFHSSSHSLCWSGLFHHGVGHAFGLSFGFGPLCHVPPCSWMDLACIGVGPPWEGLGLFWLKISWDCQCLLCVVYCWCVARALSVHFFIHLCVVCHSHGVMGWCFRWPTDNWLGTRWFVFYSFLV